MTEFHPVPEPRKTLTHAGCIVSAPLGYRPLQLDLHVPPGTARSRWCSGSTAAGG
ncbi:hypothetical protein GCM10027610_027950 [Dactylosporangium cerinum]